MMNPAAGLVLVLVAGLAMGIAACRSGGAAADGGAAPVAPVAEDMPAPGVTGARARLIGDSRRDLARRLGLGIGDIAVKSVTAVTWRDSSLGCPRPGQVYAQVLVPGYRIVLGAKGREYAYHTDAGRRFTPCP